MLIDLYDLLQEENGVRNYPVELESKEFKTKKSRYPISDSDIKLSFRNKGKKHIDFKCVGKVTLIIPCEDVYKRQMLVYPVPAL